MRKDLLRRLEKLESLRARGIDPFGHRFPVTHWAGELGRRFHAAGEDLLKQAGPVAGGPAVIELPAQAEGDVDVPQPAQPAQAEQDLDRFLFWPVIQNFE